MTDPFQSTAPVQASRQGRIPWQVHQATWEVYAACGNGDQSAERVAERGGFSWAEIGLMLGNWNPWAKRPLSAAERSKLGHPAEREQAKLREALAELVRLKDEKAARQASGGLAAGANRAYQAEKDAAWRDARAALAATTEDPATKGETP